MLPLSLTTEAAGLRPTNTKDANLKSYRKPLGLTGIGLTSLFLLMLLTACTTTKTVFITPPAALMEDCPETPVAITTNATLATKVRALKGDLRHCNDDKASLREWSKRIGR